MNLNANRTVRELATEIPNATRVFEKFGIDYCCGGGQPLQIACQKAKISVDDVVRGLENVDCIGSSSSSQAPDIQNAKLGELIAHIVAMHHAYVKNEIPRLKKLLAKVVAVHGASHPELAAVQRTFAAIADELQAHMTKEEMVLFPYIEKVEDAIDHDNSLPRAPFGPISNPVHMMELEHESAGKALEEIRLLTAGYTPPDTACFSYRTLYAALREFESDLHQHVHLENNILFPKAIELERRS